MTNLLLGVYSEEMDIFLYTLLFVFGLIIGSFLNVVIDRCSFQKSLSGRSVCDSCHKVLCWVDLVPVFSFFALGGHCRFCKKNISWYYPVVEIVTGIMFVTSWMFLGQGIIEKASYIGVMAVCVAVFFADIKYHIIPDEAHVAGIVSAIPLVFAQFVSTDNPFQSNVVAGIALTLTLYFLHLVTRGRGMGLGDVKFAFVMGLILGFERGFWALYIAFMLGGIVSLALILLRMKKLKSHIAFGPFLVVGMLAVLYFQEHITELMKLFITIY